MLKQFNVINQYIWPGLHFLYQYLTYTFLNIMKVNKKYLKYFCIFFIILTFQTQINAQETAIQNNKITYYSVGDVISGQNTVLNQGKGFYIIQIEQLMKKFLFVDLTSKGQSQFIDISIYLYRGTQKTPFKVCKQQEVDSCFVPQSELQKNSQLLVIVDCQSACQYQLKLQWSNIEHLNPGDNVKFMFAQQKSQLYHLELQKNGDFAQVRLILKPQTRRQMFDKVKIYGKYGSDSVPTADDHDFKSMHLWLDAEGIYLQKRQMKQKNMNLLIVGQSNTVYILTCEIVNKTTHDLQPGTILDEYLQPQEEATYHINFTTNGKIQYEQYVFKFSAFNGNLTIGLYIDQEHTLPYTVQPYEYMADAQFTFQRQQIVASLPKGIYIKIKSFDRISTYIMEFVGRSKESKIELKQNIYEITEIQYQKPRLLYFNAYFFQGEQTYQDNYSFAVNLINVQGNNAIVFRICEKDFQKCLDPETFTNYSSVLDVVRYDQIGTKKAFRFEVPKSLLTNINVVQQKIVVLMVISAQESSSSIVALQYFEQSKYQILRQSRPVETHLKVHETKLYKFTNVDKKIKQIRIHINKISGIVNVVSLRRSPQIKNDGKKETSNILYFTSDLLDKPIFLIIFAEQQAIISLNVQLVHENKEHIASITMQEDLQFKIKIPPLQVQLLQVHPVLDSLYFDYKSSGLAVVCEYFNNKCKNQVPEMGIQGSIVAKNFNSRNQLIMVQNPSDSKTIQFTAIYHSSDYSHCEHKKVGTIYSQIIQKQTCYTYPLSKMEDIQIFISRMDLGNIHVAFLLCNNVLDLKHEHGKDKYTIEKDVINKNCKDQQHKILTVIVSGQKLVEQQAPGKVDTKKQKTTGQIKLKIKTIVQYLTEGAIIIPDGVAYQSSKTASQEALQVFYYEVLNKVNTIIIVTNKIGNSYFTVKTVNTVDRHKLMGENSFDFSSNNSNYYMNPVITVPKQFLQKAQCKDQCTLIIKVFSKDKIGARNDFLFQITQNYFVLEEHKMKDDFLPKDAITYYSFFNKEKGNSLLVQTSDNNRKCTKIILSDREYPSDVNNIQVEYGNQLVMQNAQNKTYFIAVSAIENCGYSISVSCTQTHITHLERGKLGYLKLKEGQVKYFMFHRLSSNPFKILSNHIYGQIQFYLNRTNSEDVSDLVKKKTIDYQSFKVKGQYKNRLIMDEDLCENCYYILACYAKKPSDTSIYLGDNDSFLSISEKKSVNDLLKHTGQTLKGYYYDVQNTNLKVKVHSGKLQVKVTYYDQTYEKQFLKLDDLYEQSFKLKRKQDDWSPASIELTAMADETLYSIRFQSQTSTEYSNVVDQTQVTPGQPNYIYMTAQRVYCLRGYLRDKNQLIIITADELYEHGLKQMKVQVVINGSEVKFDKEIVRNIISIKIPMDDTYIGEAKKYGICLSSQQQSFSATAFQTQDVNILPADVQTVAYGTRQYAIRPNGNFLIDVFQCVGKANITYSESLKKLTEAKKNSLDILGMPDQPHALKISEYLTTFLKVQSQMSIVRWIPMDQKDQTGLGYLQYKVGLIKYSSNSENVLIQWQSLSKKTQSHTIVKQVNYTIYVSNQTQILQSAQNCDYYRNLQKILTFKTSGDTENSLNTTKRYELKKSELVEKYPQLQNLFVSIVAEVDIQPVRGSLEHYRFFYTKQQIPKDVFVSNTEYLDKAMYIGMIVAGIVAFLIFTWVCTKKIIPLLARLKNRMLVQQEDGKNQQQLGDVPPPSSERKTIQKNIQTEDKMSDQIKN